MIRLIISEPSILLKQTLNQLTNELLDYKDDFNYCVFDFEETPLDEILDSLETPAFGSLKKMVICKNPYFIKGEKVKLPFENDISKLEEYIKNPNPDSELIIICNEKHYSERSKFVSLIKNNGEIKNLLLDENEFYNYALALIKQTKIDIISSAIRILVDRCENNVCRLEREIAKLSSYMDRIDDDIIKKMVARPLEDNVFDLSNALINKDHKSIMRIYNDLKLAKTEPINLIALLANQFRLILQVAILTKRNMKREDIASQLNVHPYRVKVAADSLNKYNLNSIKDILVELANLDIKIKNGQNDRYVDFELFLATK